MKYFKTEPVNWLEQNNNSSSWKCDKYKHIWYDWPPEQ